MACGDSPVGDEPSPDGSPASDASPPNSDADAAADLPDGPRLVCWADGGQSLVPDARFCTLDSDCVTIMGMGCCGGSEIGVASSQRDKYVSCVQSGCGVPGAECFRYSFRTDTGEVTSSANGGAPADPVYMETLHRGIRVACAAGLCSSSFVPSDAGTDQ